MGLVFDPTGVCHNAPTRTRQSLGSFAGKTVGFIDNAKPNFHFLVDDLAELLMSRYGAAGVIKRAKRSAAVPAPAEIVSELAERCDIVITGSGD